MIPKKLHYIWLGKSPKPKIFHKCYKSWKKHLPDYEFFEWNESNLPLEINLYAQEAINRKKYAFASDFYRFYVLYLHGGIYLDIDVEVLKPLDPLLKLNAFTGYEEKDLIAPGLIFGSSQFNPLIREMYLNYDNIKFIENGVINYTTVCTHITKFLSDYPNKNELKNNLTVFDMEYFQPTNLKTGVNKITQNTFTIHHYTASWKTKKQKLKSKITKIIIATIGKYNFNRLLYLLNWLKGK
jgi:mannosyltransferase OCH1-like enzyme